MKDLTKAVALAWNRMGDPAKWLVDFAYRDLSKLKKQAVDDVAYEVFALAASELLSYRPIDKGDVNVVLPQNLDIFFNSYYGAGLFSKKPGSLLTALQEELKKRLEQCRRGGVWEFDRPAVRERFEVFTRAGNLPKVFFAFAPDETPLQSLLGIATNVIKAERERFGICENPRCGKPLVAERKHRAKYCSHKCASYVNVNKMRGKL